MPVSSSTYYCCTVQLGDAALNNQKLPRVAREVAKSRNLDKIRLGVNSVQSGTRGKVALGETFPRVNFPHQFHYFSDPDCSVLVLKLNAALFMLRLLVSRV